MLRLKLLGGLSVESAGAPVGGSAGQPRRMALLAVIARSGARGITRDHLQSLLWPDLDDERARRVLTQALYALRRDLGDEDAIAGVKELRLDTRVISCDLLEFEAALARGDLERAAAAYGGPFLYGFRLTGSPEFERWTDEVRTSLAHRYVDTLEKLGRDATTRGDANAAVQWWRLVAGQDPLNARFTAELMHALVAAGNATGALQQARIYEALIDEELSLPPDREIERLAQQIRKQATAAPPVAQTPPPQLETPSPPTSGGVEAAAPNVLPSYPSADAVISAATRRPQRLFVIGAVIAVIVFGIFAAALLRARAEHAASDPPIVLIGTIRDHRSSADSEGLGTTADLLATSLARVQGLRVISTARVYELLAQMGVDLQSPSPGDIAAAARLAGATQLIDGDVYLLADGALRLDLRRTRLPNGELAGSHTIVGMDLFALVDTGTIRLAHDAGARPPIGSIADVTTSSELAYRFYEEGLRNYFRSDFDHAWNLFEAALREDSTFAMAAFYAGLSANWVDGIQSRALLERARRLAVAVSDRERLIIQAGFAYSIEDSSVLAIAETLAVRYPSELEGHLYSGSARIKAGQPETALEPLRRVVTLDSLAFRSLRPRCLACDALDQLVSVYVAMDSSSAALRHAIRWTQLQPESPRPWLTVAYHRMTLGQVHAAASALRRATELDPSLQGRPEHAAYFWIRQDRADTAEAEIRRVGETGALQHRFDRLWFLTIALREQGKLREALITARDARKMRRPPPDTLIGEAVLLEAQVLLEAGQPRVAAAILDSVGRVPIGPWPSAQASHVAWALTHRASALFAAGDTSALAALVDSIDPISRRTLNRLHVHHYARGLLYRARGDFERAAEELRLSLPSRLMRARHQLAQVLMRLDRPEEAVPQLQAALRGGIEAGSLYITRTELHETLAMAWDAAGRPDSAAMHYRIVANSWRDADPALRARREAALRQGR